jgi:hypothetical protein
VLSGSSAGLRTTLRRRHTELVRAEARCGSEREPLKDRIGPACLDRRELFF